MYKIQKIKNKKNNFPIICICYGPFGWHEISINYMKILEQPTLVKVVLFIIFCIKNIKLIIFL